MKKYNNYIATLGISTFVSFVVGVIFKVPNNVALERLRGLSNSVRWRKEYILQEMKNSTYFFGDYFLFNAEYAFLAFLFTMVFMYYAVIKKAA